MATTRSVDNNGALFPAERVGLLARLLTLADQGCGNWTVYSDGKFPTIKGFEQFVADHKPAAIYVLATPHLKAERTLGGVAILSSDSPDSAGSAEAPSPEMTQAPAMVPEPVTEPIALVTAPAAAAKDLGITDPRFEAQLKLYETQIHASATQPFETKVGELNAKLDEALEREEQTAIQAGDLNQVTAIRSERNAIAEANYPPESEVEDKLSRFRNIWVQSKSKIDEERAAADGKLRDAFFLQIEGLIRTLTQEEKIDEAVKLQSFLEKLNP